MENVSISLGNLTIISLDVDPTADGGVEFQLHATIDAVDEGALAALESKELDPKEVICEVRPRG